MQYTRIDILNNPVILDLKEAQLLHSYFKTKVMPLMLPYNEKSSIKTVVYGAVLHNEGCDNINHQQWMGYNFAYQRNEGYSMLKILEMHHISTMVSGGLMFTPFAALVESDIELPISAGRGVTAFLRYGDMDILTNVINREYVYAFKEIENNALVDLRNWRKTIDDNRLMQIAFSIS